MSRISAKTKICMIIGDPVEHSLSPVMHNAAYEKLGIDDKFVYIAVRVNKSNLAGFISGIRAMGIRGISVTIPHKTEIMQYLDEIDEVAEKIGAVNTIVNENGILKGYNTDWQGILLPLEKKISLKDKKVAILGAGGAARAMAYAVSSRGAKFIIYNRTLDTAKTLAREFGGQASSFDSIADAAGADIVMNATALGMLTQATETPLPKEFISSNQIIFDAIYTPFQTTLLREAGEAGARVIHGIEMLLYQGSAQFELFTLRSAPVEQMREILISYAK